MTMVRQFRSAGQRGAQRFADLSAIYRSAPRSVHEPRALGGEEALKLEAVELWFEQAAPESESP